MKIYPFFLQNAGCPNHCLFCNQERSVSAHQLMDTRQVTSRLDSILPRQGDGEIAFYGGSFTMLSHGYQLSCLDAARTFVKQGRAGGIRISTRPDALGEDILKLLLNHGVTTVEIGCQSFDDHVLMQVQRGHSAEQNRASVLRCLSAGFQVVVQLMPGLPGGSREEALESVRKAINLKPSFLRIYPAVVLDGTGLADEWRANRFLPWTLDQAVDACADILRECRSADVRIIRMGLQHDKALQKNLLAGPYHPAFGQLVRSRLWRRALAAQVTGSEVAVNPVDFSDALGHCGENRAWLENNCFNIKLKSDRAVMPGYMKTALREVSLMQMLATGESHACQ